MYHLKIDDDIVDKIIKDTLTRDYHSMMDCILNLINTDYSKLQDFEKEDLRNWYDHLNAFQNILSYYLVYYDHKKLMEDTEEQFNIIQKYMKYINKD